MTCGLEYKKQQVLNTSFSDLYWLKFIKFVFLNTLESLFFEYDVVRLLFSWFDLKDIDHEKP